MSIYQIISYPLFLVAALEILLGFILLRNNPRRSPAQRSVAAFSFLSAAFALCTAVMYLRAHLGLNYDLFARANWIGWFIIPAALQFIYFMKDEASRTARRIGMVLYPYWFVVFCISIFTNLIELDNYQLIPYVDNAGPLGKPARLSGFLMIIWVMYGIYSLRKRMTGLKRAQMNYFAYGVLIFGAGGGISAGLMPLVTNSGFEPGLGAYFSLPWVVLTFYAITRYRLFDIRFFISKAVTILLLSALFSAIHIGLFNVLEPVLGPTFAILISLSLIGSIFFGTPFSSAVQRWVQSIVLKGKYDYQRVLKDSTRAIVTFLDLEEVLRHLSSTVRASLGVSSARLYLETRTGTFTLRELPGEPAAGPMTFGSDLLQLVGTSGSVMIRAELELRCAEGEPCPLVKHMKESDLEILIPLVLKGKLLGVLLLGPKGSKEPYQQTDIDLLETLAAHAAVAIENARLYDESRDTRQSLEASELRFRNLVEATSDWVWEMDTQGAYIYVSAKIRDILGYEPGEVLGRTPFDLMPHEESERSFEQFASILRSRRPFRDFQSKSLHKEGRLIETESSGVPSFDADGAFTGYRGISRDVTERKKLESQLRYAQKMEAIGKLAGGVAHDFNNILTAIVGHGNVLRMKMPREDPLRVHIDQILASTERAANLTQSLLSYGRKQSSAMKVAELNEVVRRAEKLLTGLLRENIELSFEPAEGPMNVLADTTQIERVLMNLAVNARDAMPDGGRLSIRLGRDELDHEFIRIHGYGRAGSYAHLSVSDTGAGMDEATQKRIFEPFFTTKGPGKGSGFGLSIVYSIVKEHRGYIKVSSQPGRGSTFHVYLPLLKEKTAEKSAGHPLSSLEGRETLLIAEDDEAIRTFMTAVFEGFGYTVLPAADGEEALKKFQEQGADIQLLILDLIMPKMNGREAYDAIQKLRPGIKTLFLSGYSEDVILRKNLLEPGMNLVVKPVSPKELLARARAILEGRPVGSGEHPRGTVAAAEGT